MPFRPYDGWLVRSPLTAPSVRSVSKQMVAGRCMAGFCIPFRGKPDIRRPLPELADGSRGRCHAHLAWQALYQQARLTAHAHAARTTRAPCTRAGGSGVANGIFPFGLVLPSFSRHFSLNPQPSAILRPLLRLPSSPPAGARHARTAPHTPRRETGDKRQQLPRRTRCFHSSGVLQRFALRLWRIACRTCHLH